MHELKEIMEAFNTAMGVAGLDEGEGEALVQEFGECTDDFMREELLNNAVITGVKVTAVQLSRVRRTYKHEGMFSKKQGRKLLNRAE